MKTVLYYFIFFFWFIASLLPLRFLYIFSDLLYFPLYYCVRYRRKIVRKNLIESFPEKELGEIQRIEKAFYHYFCDYMVETIKLFSMSEEQMRRRMTFGGVEKINEIIRIEIVSLIWGTIVIGSGWLLYLYIWILIKTLW